MPLAANSKLGPYEIKSTLGVGGMGEVYRARDSRLNRDVAIKVLRENGSFPDLRSRFEREARAVAALNHPNIIAVYDFGIEAGRQYIVSELLEGESLRSLLHGKPVPVRKLIDIAAQVADGLAAAHAAGVVHRDLKPENIMLDKDGRIKILDFGLARQTRATSSPRRGTGAEKTVAPPADETTRLTSEGAVLGTASYMSPEQALGKEVDYRSDQFSFGLILHEMASGKQAFARNSSVETMAAIIRDEPSAIEEKIPAPFKWIIDRCLHKEPAQRYESSRDLYRDLRNLRDHFSEAYSSTSFPAVGIPTGNARRWIPPAISAACIALTAILVYAFKPAGQDVGSYRYTPFASHASGGYWSPNGKAIAYSGNVNGTSQVFLRFLNSSVPIQMTHVERSIEPIGWSGDGSHVIAADSLNPSKIYSVPAVGGEPELIMSADCSACALSGDGKSLADFTMGKDGVFELEISDPLGSPFRRYRPAPFETKEIYDLTRLSFSPDGKTILLLINDKDNKQRAWLLPYPGDGQAPRTVLPQIADLKNSPTFGWMPDNHHVVLSIASQIGVPSHLWMADIRSEKSTAITNGIADESWPTIAPDGKSILFNQYTERLDVVSLSVLDGSIKTLVSTGHHENTAAWAGKRNSMAWVTDRAGISEVWVRSQDGSDRTIVTSQDFPGARFMNPSLSPDGDRIIFTNSDRSGVIRLWISSLAGGSPIRLTNAATDPEVGGVWSPDGSRYAYLAGNGDQSLVIVKTSGGASPTTLRKGILSFLPDWSPTGGCITSRDEKGWSLISPEGKPAKFLGQFDTPYLVFSKDEKFLYGILFTDPKTGRPSATLFSLDVATLKTTVIKELGPDYRPREPANPSIRFSMAPDGKSFLYTTGKSRADLWMLQDYRQPSWQDELRSVLGR
jgi:eukaryotic-like serine/threonine-protein kinase